MPKAYSYKRFSSEKQQYGDSIRRQTEMARKWLDSHPELDLVLDETIHLEDKGLSAYKGLNSKIGALGIFIRMVQDGAIEEGSYLLVENFDRLSREAPLTTLQNLQSLILNGVIVVTLNDGKTYSKASLEGSDGFIPLLTSIISMYRANEESRVKGERVSAAWSNKFNKIKDGEQLTKKVPFWINPNRTINEGNVETVRLIFNLAKQGYGGQRIAQYLTENKIPTPTGRTNVWAISSVKKILASEAVIGTLKTADGQKHNNYYPRIIDDATWLQTRYMGVNQRHSRNTHNVYELSGIFKCRCGGTVTRVSKTGRIKKDGTRSKWESLICSKMLVSASGCVYKSIPYDMILRTTIDLVRGLEYEAPQQDQIAKEIFNAEGYLNHLLDDLRDAYEIYRKVKSVTAREKYEGLEKERIAVEDEISRLRQSIGAVGANTFETVMNDIFNNRNVTNSNLRKIIQQGTIDFIAETITIKTHLGLELSENLDHQDVCIK